MASLGLRFDLLSRGAHDAEGDLDRVGRASARASTHIGALGKGLRVGLGASVGVAGTAVVGLAAAFKGGIEEAISYQKITDQVAQTIRSTKGAAGVSAAGLKAYAGQLESLSGVDEELILKSQNVLLTFTDIRNEVGRGNDIYNQASLAALNLATTLGTDVSGAAVQIGKALNNPTKGITALSRAGVSFTEQQKAQIKALQKSGDTLGAQKIILSELNKEFGGAAKAAGQGFGGTIARLKDTVSDTFRDIATRALPFLTRLADFLSKALPAAIDTSGRLLSTLGASVKQVFDILFKGDFKGGPFDEDSAFVDTLFDIREQFERFKPALTSVFDFLKRNAQPILIGLGVAFAAFTAPVTSTIAALVVLYARSQTFRDIIQSVVDYVRSDVVPAFQRFGDYLTGTVFPALVKVGQFLVTTFKPTFVAVRDVLVKDLAPALSDLGKSIQSTYQQMQPIIKVFAAAVVVVAAVGAKIAGFLEPIIVRLQGTVLRLLIERVAAQIKLFGTFLGIIGTVAGKFADVGRAIGTFVQGALGKLGGFLGGVRRFLQPVISLIERIAGAARTTKDALDALPGVGGGGKSVSIAGRGIGSVPGNPFGGTRRPETRPNLRSGDSIVRTANLAVRQAAPAYFSAGKTLSDSINKGVSSGLDKGKDTVAKKVTDAAKKAADAARKAQEALFDRMKAAAAAAVEAAKSAVEKGQAAYDRLLDKLSAAKDRLKDIYSAATDLRASITQSLAGSVSDLFGKTSISDVLQAQKDQLVQLVQFTQDIARLKARGLGNSFINELLKAGPSQAGMFADLLANSSAAELNGFVASRKEIDRLSQDTARAAEEATYGTQIALAQRQVDLAGSNLLAGQGALAVLTRQERNAEAAENRLARKIAEALKAGARKT